MFMSVMRSYLLSFYVEDCHGRHIKLGEVSVTRDWVSTEELRTRVGEGLGIRGWNDVACGRLRLYNREGGGIRSSVIDRVYVDGDCLRVVLLDGSVVSGIESGSISLPKRRGLSTKWTIMGEGILRESVESVESKDSVESVVLRVLTREALVKYTKAELVSLSEVWGVDGLRMSMLKSEMIDYIIENG